MKTYASTRERDLKGRFPKKESPVKNNPETLKKYYQQNKQKYKEYWKMQRIRNPDDWKWRHKENEKKFDSSAKGIWYIMKVNSAKRNHTLIIDRKEFIEWYSSKEKKCYYCGVQQGEKRLEIERKDNKEGYVEGNIELACADCNGVKGNILTESEMLIIGELVMKKRYDKSQN